MAALLSGLLAGPALSEQVPLTPVEARLWTQAVAYMRAGAPEDAIPLLDDLVSRRPENRTARLELGFALLQTQRWGRSRYQIDRALAGNTDGQQVAAAQQMLAAIEANRRWSGYLDLAIRPETNPGRQTSQSQIQIIGLPFTLGDDARAQETTTVLVSSGLSFRYPLGQWTKLDLGVDTWSRFSEEVQLRDHQLSFRIAPTAQLTDTVTLTFGATLRRRWTSERHASDTTGGFLAASYRQGSKLFWNVHLSREDVQKFDGTQAEDKSRLMVQLSAQISPTFLLRGRLDVTRTDTAVPEASGDLAEIRLVGMRSFRKGIDLRAEAWHRRDIRDGPSFLFGVTREDLINGAELGLSDRDLRIGPFVPEVIVGLENGTSTISLHDFENRYVSVGLRARF